MPTLRSLSILLMLSPAVALAQSNDSSSWSQPPLVDAPATDVPRAPTQPIPSTATMSPGPATPPPPGYSTPPPGAPPAATMPPGAAPYSPYSPYAQQTGPQQKPGPEVGLMVTESLFGMLTSAGTALIPYYLLIKPFSQPQQQCDVNGNCQLVAPDPTIVNLLFILTFSAVPLAVSQTELALANGSRYYISESWTPALAGLLAEAGVVGLKYLLQANLQDAGEGILLIGTIAFVPLAEMAAINIFKAPRYRFGYGPISGLLNYSPENGLTAGVPMPLPVLAQSSTGLGAGLSMNLLSGRF